MEELLLDKLNGIFLTHTFSIKSQNLHKVNMNDSIICNKVVIPATFILQTSLFKNIKNEQTKKFRMYFYKSQILRTFH